MTQYVLKDADGEDDLNKMRANSNIHSKRQARYYYVT
jgi:hypothetical protein